MSPKELTRDDIIDFLVESSTQPIANRVTHSNNNVAKGKRDILTFKNELLQLLTKHGFNINDEDVQSVFSTFMMAMSNFK